MFEYAGLLVLYSFFGVIVGVGTGAGLMSEKNRSDDANTVLGLLAGLAWPVVLSGMLGVAAYYCIGVLKRGTFELLGLPRNKIPKAVARERIP